MTCMRVKGPGRRHGFVCFGDDRLEVANPDCPNVAQHEPWPRGYCESSEYADKMMETHDQSQCSGCGMWLIWTPKGSA